MKTIEILDVTLIHPALGLRDLIKKMESLSPGGRFVLYAHHDPGPLFFRHPAYEGEDFNLRYLRKGPDRWDVLVSRNVFQRKDREALPANRRAAVLSLHRLTRMGKIKEEANKEESFGLWS